MSMFPSQCQQNCIKSRRSENEQFKHTENRLTRTNNHCHQR